MDILIFMGMHSLDFSQFLSTYLWQTILNFSDCMLFGNSFVVNLYHLSNFVVCYAISHMNSSSFSSPMLSFFNTHLSLVVILLLDILCWRVCLCELINFRLWTLMYTDRCFEGNPCHRCCDRDHGKKPLLIGKEMDRFQIRIFYVI